MAHHILSPGRRDFVEGQQGVSEMQAAFASARDTSQDQQWSCLRDRTPWLTVGSPRQPRVSEASVESMAAGARAAGAAEGWLRYQAMDLRPAGGRKQA